MFGLVSRDWGGTRPPDIVAYGILGQSREAEPSVGFSNAYKTAALVCRSSHTAACAVGFIRHLETLCVCGHHYVISDLDKICALNFTQFVA